MSVKDIDSKLLYLMNKLYNMSDEDEKKFLELLEDFSEQEKIDLAYDLFSRIKKEESIIKRFYSKIKMILNSKKEKLSKEQEDLDNMLLIL